MYRLLLYKIHMIYNALTQGRLLSALPLLPSNGLSIGLGLCQLGGKGFSIGLSRFFFMFEPARAKPIGDPASASNAGSTCDRWADAR